MKAPRPGVPQQIPCPKESLSCTRLRATPHDVVILWTDDSITESDMEAVQVIAEGLATDTGSVLAVIPASVLTGASSHGLGSLCQLRDELDKMIQKMSTEQSAGEA